MQEYAPGTGTAVLMVLPTASLVLYKSIQGGFVDRRKFYVIGPIVVLIMAASVPLLFAIWRAFGSWQSNKADARAKRILQKAFPFGIIEQIAIDGIASGGGCIHYATQ